MASSPNTIVQMDSFNTFDTQGNAFKFRQSLVQHQQQTASINHTNSCSNPNFPTDSKISCNKETFLQLDNFDRIKEFKFYFPIGNITSVLRMIKKKAFSKKKALLFGKSRFDSSNYTVMMRSAFPVSPEIGRTKSCRNNEKFALK